MNKMNIKILLKIFVFLILALSCSDTNDDQIEPVVYSDSIDFYDENNMSDDFVFVVENSSTNSYLINKQGFKVWEWNFDTNSGNDLEILPNGEIAWKYNKGEAGNIWRAYHYSVNGQVSESLGLIQD